VLAVVAHPDDESFALGALLDRFVGAGTEAAVLCLTRGEASTLGVDGEAPVSALADVRRAELRSAARVLGLSGATLLDHPDGGLSDPGLADVLEADVAAAVRGFGPDGLLVFDPLDGVTGHDDHAAASTAALAVAARTGLPVLGWALPGEVAERLNGEFGSGFAGHPVEELVEVPVDRDRQDAAVRCHVSQAVPESVLWRRLELLGDVEYVRFLH
jgi:LmbE family N-acetylglucosaminyl deacetylase